MGSRKAESKAIWGSVSVAVLFGEKDLIRLDEAYEIHQNAASGGVGLWIEDRGESKKGDCRDPWRLRHLMNSNLSF